MERQCRERSGKGRIWATMAEDLEILKEIVERKIRLDAVQQLLKTDQMIVLMAVLMLNCNITIAQ